MRQPNFDRRKAFGQHFLIDPVSIDSVVRPTLDAIDECRAQALVEIGPGQGAITHPLLEKKPLHVPMTVIEKDYGLIEHWENDGRPTVLGKDFLELSREQWMPTVPFVLVSNLPYSVGTRIFLKIIDESAEAPFDHFQRMILMFQKEVADRIRAEPGSKDWGSLSLTAQVAWDFEKLRIIPPKAFRPPPKIDSEVLMCRRRAEPRIVWNSPDQVKQWGHLVRQLFSQRRKMVRSQFSSVPGLKEALVACDLSETDRAESWNWDQWQRLWTAIQK